MCVNQSERLKASNLTSEAGDLIKANLVTTKFIWHVDLRERKSQLPVLMCSHSFAFFVCYAVPFLQVSKSPAADRLEIQTIHRRQNHFDRRSTAAISMAKKKKNKKEIRSKQVFSCEIAFCLS